MTIPEKLQALRAVMKANGIDIYVVPTDDFHQSEYVGEHFKARAYITGFTGSAGTASDHTGRSRTVDRWEIFPAGWQAVGRDYDYSA